MPIEKGADRLIDIPADLVVTGFKLQINAFALASQSEKLLFTHIQAGGGHVLPFWTAR